MAPAAYGAAPGGGRTAPRGPVILPRRHGFSDANGRTGRVLFGICWLRGGGEFQGITMHGEQRLPQLP